MDKHARFYPAESLDDPSSAFSSKLDSSSFLSSMTGSVYDSKQLSNTSTPFKTAKGLNNNRTLLNISKADPGLAKIPRARKLSEEDPFAINQMRSFGLNISQLKSWAKLEDDEVRSHEESKQEIALVKMRTYIQTVGMI